MRKRLRAQGAGVLRNRARAACSLISCCSDAMLDATNRSWWRAVFGTSGRWAVFGLLGGLQADEWAGSPDCRQG
uniref:Uncharacterized protein n=1 Tax=Phytophthora fragariae TaxID=53985 RepID=A0A6A3E2H2_9STRA|nr:hypothetical protein PF009_g22083 [Phytophthora fragariae]